jgi:Methyltransferase FkbM domain
MRLTVGGDDGEPIEFDCPDTIASRWTCTSILEGETYPYLPFVEDVQVVFDIGANSVDRAALLYKGDGDLGMASVIRRSVNLDESEPVELRAARGWAADQGIDRIDVLKVDVEGCEIEVLTSLAALCRP